MTSRVFNQTHKSYAKGTIFLRKLIRLPIAVYVSLNATSVSQSCGAWHLAYFKLEALMYYQQHIPALGENMASVDHGYTYSNRHTNYNVLLIRVLCSVARDGTLSTLSLVLAPHSYFSLFTFIPLYPSSTFCSLSRSPFTPFSLISCPSSVSLTASSQSEQDGFHFD